MGILKIGNYFLVSSGFIKKVKAVLRFLHIIGHVILKHNHSIYFH